MKYFQFGWNSAISLIFILIIYANCITGCSKGNSNSNRGSLHDSTTQVKIPLVENMATIPVNYLLIDWKKRATDFDAFIYDNTKTGTYLPIFQTDISNHTMKIPSYVGVVLSDGGEEAVANLQSVLGASLAGIDKSNQAGIDYVEQIEAYKNSENVITNNPNQLSKDCEFWYCLLPTVEFAALTDLYPNVNGMETNMKIVADKWYDAIIAMGGNNLYFSHTGFDFTMMQPFDRTLSNGGAWIEPDAAAGAGIFLYWAYQKFHDQRYLQAAGWCANFLENQNFSPSYETLIIWAPLLGARLNAEQGQQNDILKLLGQFFNTSSDVRQGWGMRMGVWGGYGADGLVGADYYYGNAYAMNSIIAAMGIVPTVRYDQRFARSIGKWMLNVASNARLFFGDQLPLSNQDSLQWNGDPANVIPYEGLRNINGNVSPFAAGDALQNGWAPTDFGIYSGAPTGVLGGIIQPTNVEKILQLDLLKTDFFHSQAFPSFLYYNPYQTIQTVQINVGMGNVDIYDAASDNYLRTNISGITNFPIAPDQAVVVVLAPANGNRTHEINGNVLINNVFVAHKQQ